MDFKEIQVGRHYAYRVKPRDATEELKHARILETLKVAGHRSRKRGEDWDAEPTKNVSKGMVKVRHLSGPHEGLEEFVPSRLIMMPWSEHKAFLRDEQRYTRLQEVSAKKFDKVVAEAVFTTFEATGDDAGWNRNYSYAMPLDAARRIAQRAKMDEPVERLHEAAFVDRHGELHLPLTAAARLAQTATAEPEAVLHHIDSIDEQWRAEGYRPGQRYIHGLLREHQPQFALCRQWAGFESSVAKLRREIERLN